MTAKRKAKAAGERRQRKFTPWESDRVSPSSPSSLDVLVEFLTAPGNAQRWRQVRARKGLYQEVLAALEGHGISHRELGDVDRKVRVLEKQFVSARSFLSVKKAGEAFERGEADIVQRVLRLCPQYRELLAVFGRDSTGREAQLAAAATEKRGTAAIAAAQRNGATSSPTEAGEGGKSAAGKWKESLEKNRPRTANEEQREMNAEQAPRGLVKQMNAANGEKKTRKEKESAAVTGVAATVASGEQGDDGKKKEAVGEGKSGEQKNRINGKHAIVVEEEGTLADADEDQSEDEPKTQVHVESEGESSEEEELEAAAAVKSKYALKMKNQHEAEESSSEEESSEEETEDSQVEEDEDIDGEERIPLAQPDEDEEGKVNSEVKADKDGESDNNEEEEEELEEEAEDKEDTENEAEGDEEDDDEEEEADGEEQEADGANDSDSSSSESDEANNETDVNPTPNATVTQSSDHDEEAQHDSESDDDDEVEEADQKRSDSDVETPLHSRKRSSKEAPGLPAKRARNVTRDLEREAYIQQAKQEQAQRQQLFQLERAKLECDLEAKRVHLAMEKILARKKLLGAGVDPAEVDRVLPL